MDVGQLFRERTVAEIREVEARTHHEIEEKKQQLRHVVGDSYRDLISSADTIIDIARSCQRLVELTGSLQEGLGGLATGAAVGGGGPPAPSAGSYDRLYALGSRIKYLIDTPETIYGCLDGREFLAAARRFVRATDAHRVLTAGQAKQVAQRFPLLQHQWPLVKKFRPQVYNAAGAWLGSHGELSAAQAAAALAAQALLKPMDGAEVLKAFLTARQAYIMQCLSAATAAGADTDLDSLAFILSDVATMVCSTLAQCGELFLQLPGVSGTPLLVQALAAEDGSSVDLLFDTGKEAEAWKAHMEAVRGRLAELSAAGLALECSQWLDQLSQQLHQLGGRLLGPCASGQGLLSVEAAVKAALEEWRYALQPLGQASEAAADTAVAMSWADICQWVLGRACPLWPLLFEQPLLERAKQLVAGDFSSLLDEVAGLLGAALQEAAALPPSAPGSAQTGAWCDVFELQPTTPDATAGGRVSSSKRRRGLGQAKAGVVAQQQGGAPLAWLPQAEQVVQHLDQQLAKVLGAALDACGGGTVQQGGSTVAGVAADAQQRALGLGETAASRALILEPFVQDRCAEAAEGIAASLDARLLALPVWQAGSNAAATACYAPVATQALVLGRVALGMASRSIMLPLVLGPPDKWHAAAQSGSSNNSAESTGSKPLLGRQPSGAALAAPSSRCERLQQRLRSVGLQAYGRWATWAAEGLAGVFTAGLAEDPTLSATAPLRSWEETVIGSGGAPGGNLEDEGANGGTGGGLQMRFLLPTAASPAAVQLALAACQEIDRAGGHLLEKEPLLLLKWHLGSSLLSALTATLGEAGDVDDGAVATNSGGDVLAGKLSEKGVLQLLFDARFLLDLLSGGRPISAGAADAAGSAAAVASRRRKAAALEAQLSGRLDPIDWATYEPYLSSNKDRAAGRCQVLFGMLLRGDRLQQRGGTPSPPGAASMSADSNILRMAPVGPRFSYLPVTTPMALLRQSSMQQLPAAGDPGGEAPSTSISASGSEVSASSYSFASLLGEGGGRVRPSSEGSDGAGGSAVQAGAASSGMGKLVGLLGDKAASALGDMGGSSLLSSFNKGWL